MDELCKGKGLRGETLDGIKIKRILEDNKEIRQVHRFTTRGYTKKRTLRRIAQIPSCIFINPESPYLPYFENMSDKKDMFNFLKKYPGYLVVDKL